MIQQENVDDKSRMGRCFMLSLSTTNGLLHLRALLRRLASNESCSHSSLTIDVHEAEVPELRKQYPHSSHL